MGRLTEEDAVEHTFRCDSCRKMHSIDDLNAKGAMELCSDCAPHYEDKPDESPLWARNLRDILYP